MHTCRAAKWIESIKLLISWVTNVADITRYKHLAVTQSIDYITLSTVLSSRTVAVAWLTTDERKNNNYESTHARYFTLGS